MLYRTIRSCSLIALLLWSMPTGCSRPKPTCPTLAPIVVTPVAPTDCLISPPPALPGALFQVCPEWGACLTAAAHDALIDYLRRVQTWMADAETLCGARESGGVGSAESAIP
jgi:hypothetical protein